MTVEIDETTGLPVLPDGEFWRVRKYTKDSLQVQRRRRRWLGSKLVDYELALTSPDYSGSVEGRIAEAAREVLSRPNVRHLIGDYPPKRLNS